MDFYSPDNYGDEIFEVIRVAGKTRLIELNKLASFNCQTNPELV